jgi:hypothetical protein
VTEGRSPGERALASLREQPLPDPSELSRGAGRRRMVARLEGQRTRLLEAEARRATRARWAAATMGVAAAAALALALGSSPWRAGHASSIAAPTPPTELARLVAGRGAVDLVRARRANQVSDDTLLTGDQLRTRADGAATVRLGLGAVARLGASTEIELLSPGPPARQSEALRLVTGSVELTVPKQPPGASFSVSAPLAKVIVLGTEFKVTASAHGPTRVEVKEGRVLVEHGSGSTFLSAGAAWSSATPFEPVASATPSQTSSPPLPEPAPSSSPLTPPARSSRSPLVPSGTAAATSNLAEQNSLLMNALSARREGNDGTALRELDTLLERFPDSALSEDATVERFRALKRLGRIDDARRAARQYLALHPSGFAADEARALALVSAPARPDSSADSGGDSTP